MAESKLEHCLSPAAALGICDKIISAHTIQRSRVLDRIIDSTNHVCTFFSQQTDFSLDGPRVLRVGWKEASTFTGFCAKHDAATFRSLENAEFDGSLEKCFLVGYRALCHEIHQKSRMLKSQPTFRTLIDRGLPIEAQIEIQSMSSAQEAGFRKGLEDFGRVKTVMDKQLLERDYSGWHRTVVYFKGPLSIASTGAVSPNRDLEGNELQILHDPDAIAQELLFGIVATENGGAAVFLSRVDEAIPKIFVEGLVKKEPEWVCSLIAQFAFVYVENTFFSKVWWDSLSDLDRQHMASLAWVANAYYESFTYSRSRRIVPWEITSVKVDGQ